MKISALFNRVIFNIIYLFKADVFVFINIIFIYDRAYEFSFVMGTICEYKYYLVSLTVSRNQIIFYCCSKKVSFDIIIYF